MKGMTLQKPQSATAGSTETVMALDQLDVNTMKMATVGKTTLAIVRTKHGVYALDNACPHQGYGLTTGDLSIDDNGNAEVTCQWHNWKFRAEDGVCTIGQENVGCHQVDITNGEIRVTIGTPTNEEERERLWPSLQSGFAHDYVGQISRDSIRLLDAGATPSEVMWEGVRAGVAKDEYGLGHNLAFAADCLHLAELWPDDDKALPLIQGMSGLSEQARYRPKIPVPSADRSRSISEAIETGDAEGAMAAVVAALEDGVEEAEIRHHFIVAVSNHHLDYGHGAIYTQKAFELLGRVGWEKATDLLPALARSIAYGTREDTLPYMKKFMRSMDALGHPALEQLGNAEDRSTTGWNHEPLVNDLLEAQTEPLELAAKAIQSGAGIEGLLDAVSVAVSTRLLRYDLLTENSMDDFGWLDITHGLTYSRAARWAWKVDPGPHTTRLALFTAWLAFDTGRLERRKGVEAPDEHLPQVEQALTDPIGVTGERLSREALDDRAGSFIVLAHLLKTAQAAEQEAESTGSKLPLAAAARLIHGPRRERFVARATAESLDFIRSGRPPKR